MSRWAKLPNPQLPHMNQIKKQPKKGYLSLQAAQRQADIHNKRSPAVKYYVYVCRICFNFHVGRKPKRNMEIVHIMQGKRRAEEAMAGKLVFALRNVLDRRTVDE